MQVAQAIERLAATVQEQRTNNLYRPRTLSGAFSFFLFLIFLVLHACRTPLPCAEKKAPDSRDLSQFHLRRFSMQLAHALLICMVAA
jgi:hypothetical protein